MVTNKERPDLTPEQMAEEVQMLVEKLQEAGRTDLLLHAISVPMLEELRIEAAKGRLSRLTITRDFRFLLTDYGNRELEMQPVHKAVYLLFLAHPEGIEFKNLSDYRNELMQYYKATARNLDREKMTDSIDHLTNPLDNAINEKCSRIKKVFSEAMDEYSASYYIISSHTKRHVSSSKRIWYERLKLITLPRELVILE
ncbi:MAG: hypothetical protein IJ562_11120 [Prevotella sp.]|nr:hypothetical protein [Prevotella sp.]